MSQGSHLRATEPTLSVPTLHKVPWLANLLGISQKQAYEAISARQVPPEIVLRFGRRIRIVEEKAIAWIMGEDVNGAA